MTKYLSLSKKDRLEKEKKEILVEIQKIKE